MSDNKIIIIGAGLSGTLLAIRMAQRGFQVELHEKRADMRKVQMSAGRSINMALSDRGIRALRLIGMDEFMLNASIPMTGRMIHSTDGKTNLQAYSGRPGEYINSISRGGLNIGLLDKAEGFENIQLFFESECVDADTERGICRFQYKDGTVQERHASLFVGADGAGSALRNAFYRHSASLRFSFSQQFLSAGYKELHIPEAEGGNFRIEKNALHIWPRGKFMMIGLPNLGGSFTMTLFTEFESETGFNTLQTEADVERYFNTYFPDAAAMMPDLCRDFFANPTGSLGTVKCSPWQYRNRFVLLGDAAHAVVPFYGQGMNCSFEDCVVLDELIEQSGDDWSVVLPAFQEARKKNTDAIADLAVENFVEMRDLVADPVYVKKRQLETKLEFAYPDYFSKYSMVTFRADLPYSYAMEMGNKQNKLLMDICSRTDDINTLDTDVIMQQIRALR